MARLENMPEPQRSHIASTKLPTFDTHPWVDGPALNMRRIAIVSTAGLHRRDDMPFTFKPGDNYRIIPDDTAANELIMSHVSTNFDRSGFQQDWNIVLPLDRLMSFLKRVISEVSPGFIIRLWERWIPGIWNRPRASWPVC